MKFFCCNKSHELLHQDLLATLSFSTGVVLLVALCGQDSHWFGEGGAEQSGRTDREEKEL